MRCQVQKSISTLRKWVSDKKSKLKTTSESFKVEVKNIRLLKRKRNTKDMSDDEKERVKKLKEDKDQVGLKNWFVNHYQEYNNASLASTLGVNSSSPARMYSRFTKDQNKDVQVKNIDVKYSGSCCKGNCHSCIRLNHVRKALLDFNTTINETDRNKKIVEFIKNFKANAENRTSGPCTRFICQLFNISSNRCYRIFQAENGAIGTEEVHHAREGISPSTKVSEESVSRLKEWLQRRLIGDPTKMVLYIPPDCEKWKQFFLKYYNCLPEDIQSASTFQKYSVDVLQPIKIKFFKHSKCDCKICSLFKQKMLELSVEESKIRGKIRAAGRNIQVVQRLQSELNDILRAVEDEKRSYQNHLNLVESERLWISRIIQTCKANAKWMCLMFDFKVPFVLPWKKNMSQDLFCSTKRKVYCFGLVDLSEQVNESKLYFFDPHISPESWKSVQSILEKHIKDAVEKRRNEGGDAYEKLVLRCDKCGGQNWNKYTIFFACILIRLYGFTSVEIHAAPPGHNKMLIDTLFGILQGMCNRRNLYTGNQLSEIADSIKHIMGYYMKENEFIDRTEFYNKVFMKTRASGIRVVNHIKIEKVVRGRYIDGEQKIDFELFFKNLGSDNWESKGYLLKKFKRYDTMITSSPTTFNQSMIGDYVERDMIDSLLQNCQHVEKEKVNEYFNEILDLIGYCDYSERDQTDKIDEVYRFKEQLGVLDTSEDDMEDNNNRESVVLFDDQSFDEFSKCMVCEYMGCKCVRSEDENQCCEACYQCGPDLSNACFELGSDRDSRMMIYTALKQLNVILYEDEWIDFWSRELPLIADSPEEVFIFGNDQEARIPANVDPGEWFKTIFVQEM